MAQKKDNGGPAFPEAIAISPAGDVYPGVGGMSLRDYFAGRALPAVISATSAGQHMPGMNAPENATIAEKMAADAYSLADAMLEARSK